jgi:hypothetical protein
VQVDARRGRPPAPGIHLHWALPDALATGRASAGAGPFTLPAVPDLWLVTRYSAGRPRRAARSWVVDARTGAVTPLTDRWTSPPVTPGRARLTAAGFFDAAGNPLADDAVTPIDAKQRAYRSAWAAYYPDAARRFGFHDDLSDRPTGPLSYAVVGWYASPGEDPLAAAGSDDARLAWLEAAKWTAEGIGTGGSAVDMGRLPTVLDEPLVLKLSNILANSPPPKFETIVPDRSPTDVIGIPPVVKIDPSLFLRDATQVVGPALSTPLGANLSRLTSAPGGLPALLSDELAADPRVIGTVLPEKDGVSTLLNPSLLEPRLPWAAELEELSGSIPDRIYCHGQVVDLPADGEGGKYDAAAPVEVNGKLAWTLGDSVGECLARVMQTDGSLRWLTHATATLRASTLGQFGELPRVQQYLHEQGFVSESGGYTWVTREAPPDANVWQEFGQKVTAEQAFDLVSAGAPAELVSGALALRDAPVTHTQGVVLLGQIAAAVGMSPAQATAAVAAPSSAVRAAATASATPSPGPGEDLITANLLLSSGATATAAAAAASAWLEEVTGIGEAGRLRAVKVPLPRLWRPTAPQLMVLGPRRGLRHWEDGRFDEQGRLVCRLTGQTVTALDLGPSASFAASDLFIEPIPFARLPATARELSREAVLLDPGAASAASQTQRKRAAGADRAEVVAESFAFEATWWWNSAWSEMAATEVASTTRYRGALPSRVALNPWRRAWNPLFIEYQMTFTPAPGAANVAWTLGEVEHRPRNLTAGAPFSLTGRAIATPAGAKMLASSLRRLADDIAGADPGRESDLRFAANDAEDLDTLSASLDGLDATLRAAGQDLRAGTLIVDALRVVDSFGQALPLDVSSPILDGDDLVAGPGPLRWLLPPRLTERARLDFRWVQANDPQADATDEAGPVVGWLVADHVDHAVEVFDAGGAPLGQLAHGPDGDARWEPAPGIEPAWGGTPDPAIHPAVRAFVTGLIDADRANSDESALSALIRLLDTVRHTVDRATETADALGTLVGRPVALCRARARIVLVPAGEDPTAARPVRSLPPGLELRLGSLTQPDDGLLAWQHEDAPTRVHPPHPAARSDARESGRGRGRSGDGTRVRQITHDYVAVDATVDLPDTAPVPLLLLMDPGTGVHATTGVLPRKKIRLEDGWVRAALSRIAPTFRAGPVLLDPALPGLPLPGAERFTWRWVRRDAPPGTTDNWSATGIETRADEAILPSARVRIHEGWLQAVPEGGG